MKYSDEQRIQKILEYSQKLRDYIQENEITKERLMQEYSLQWLVTTPLYNIGEHAEGGCKGVGRKRNCCHNRRTGYG